MIHFVRTCVRPIALAIALCGCVTLAPTDLQLSSVEAVDRKRHIGPLETQTGHDWVGSLRLKINFKTKSDLAGLAERENLMTSADIFFCENKHYRNNMMDLSDTRVFVNGVDLMHYSIKKRPADRLSPGRHDHTLHVFLGLDRLPSQSGSASGTGAVWRELQDVCFEVKQGTVGYVRRSNSVRVPKEAIKAVLQSAWPRG